MSRSRSIFSNRNVRRAIPALATVALAILAYRPSVVPAASSSPAATRPAAGIDFDAQIRPVLAANCFRCHGDAKQKGGLRLDDVASALRGGDEGPAVVPHKSADSPLIKCVTDPDPEKRMPPGGDPLPAEHIALLRTWIDQGAVGSQAAIASTQPTKDKADHWAFKPVVRPAVPAVKDVAWGRNPIDTFVLSKLEAKNLHPAPEADKRTLLRRLSFDLTGLAPTQAEMAAFLADESPAAFDKQVDRLLASPRYGRRWARRWMDVAHFAETHGNDQDRERPNAWPYRDYLVDSFNADVPYARFVEQQVAGDALYPDDPRGVVALGFLAAGPWDESSQMAVLDDTVDKLAAQNLDRDDMVSTAITTFASVTVGCARCHNHKFDPISQAEYYGLQAVFAGVERADRSFDPDPKVQAKRRLLTAQLKGLESGRYVAGASPLDPSVRAAADAWATDIAAVDKPWTTLVPTKLESVAGQTFTKLPDGSILAGGVRPDADSYVFTAVVPAKVAAVVAVRLELLTDDHLPSRGPGRQDNGNFHLTEFKVASATTAGGATVPVAVTAGRADFDQKNWTAAAAIDGDPATAWGVFPEIGKPHVAVFDLVKPIDARSGDVSLKITLEQAHGRGHVIGRFRLAVSSALPPGKPAVSAVAALPSAVAQAVGTPAAARTEADRLALTAHVLRNRLQADLAALPTPSQVYAVTRDFPANGNFKPSAAGPRKVTILRRGEVTAPGEPAVPAGLSCVAGLSGRFELADANDESARRAALAKWLSDSRNALTWRSIVNRAWHNHFGRGIVASPNDFGHMGIPPTHPELLDWLTVWFQDGGGTLKRLDRLIVTSSAYRQSSRHDPAAALADQDNLLLWRMNRPRLDAESVRDTILNVCGLLDETPGGPSAKQFVQTSGVHITPVLDYANFNVDSPAARRASVYRFLYRTLADPFMDALDCPDASQLAPTRATSVTAIQALAMLNDRFVVRYSEHLADRVSKDAKQTPARIAQVYDLCLNRPPTADELKAVTEYAEKHGLANACRMVLNSNEFVFVD